MNCYETLFNEANDFLSKNKVNVFKVIEWKNLLEGDCFDIKEYERLLLYFNVSIYKDKTGFSSVTPPNILKYIEEQVYLVLKDKKSIGKTELLVTGLISELCNEISKYMDIDVFVLSVFLDLVFLGIIKIGIGAWCKYYEDKINISENESQQQNGNK